ncbi:MAG: ferrous iron transport protein B [Anaerolineales bacterium]|nr:ferrous iron transport protein B [Anaerolineales bacterium]
MSAIAGTEIADQTAEVPDSVARAPGKRTVRIALAGQPNVGKSTIFNLLTGLSQHVGNWPGKTIEMKQGGFSHAGVTYQITDLPGTYSLTANSAEEVVAREFIIREEPDIVIAVVDAATLERSLYLVAELIALPAPVVVALNMMDVAAQQGVHIEPEVLEAAMGVKVVPMSATRSSGISELLDAVDLVATSRYSYTPKRPEIRADHQDLLQQIGAMITGRVPPPYPEDWVALKLLEGDQDTTRMMRESLSAEQWGDVQAILKTHEDALVAVASGRYEWIGRMIRAAVVRPHTGRIGLTERIDRWAAHPFWGLVLLVAILGLAFWLTYAIGLPLQGWLDENVVGGLAELARQGLTDISPWLASLVADGVIGSAGFMLTFLPILVIFFAVMGVLEDVGYMARAAYVMDSFMHLMGLHGKSFLPLFVGFGCNVPAVLGTRVIESPRARLLTIMLAPLIPCTARMAVAAFLGSAFFGPQATPVSWGMVALSLVVLAISGILLNRVMFRGERAAFIMELPLYHAPNVRTIALLVWQRTIEFVKKAGTVILPVSLVVWALSMLPVGDVESSYLAMIGKWLEPVGRVMGLNWQLIVALLTSFIAKENTIATLGVLLSAEEQVGLAATLRSTFSTPTGLAFIAMQMLFIPCVATMAAIRQETKSWRWTLFNLTFLLVVSWIGGLLVFWLARLLGL